MKEKTFERHEFTQLFNEATKRSLTFAIECLGESLPGKMAFYLSSINHRLDWDTDSKMIGVPAETILFDDETISHLLNEKGWFREGIRLSVFGVANNSTIVEVEWEGEEWTNIVPGQKPYFKETPFIVVGPSVESYNRETNTDIVYYPLCEVIKVSSPQYWVLEEKDVTPLKHRDLQQRTQAAFSLCRKLYSGFTADVDIQKSIAEAAELEVDDELKSVYTDILATCDPLISVPLFLRWTNQPNGQLRKNAYLGLIKDHSDDTFNFLLERVTTETLLDARWGVLRALKRLSKKMPERQKRMNEAIKQIELTPAEKRSLKSL